MSNNEERPVRITARQAAQMVDGGADTTVLPFLVTYHGSLVDLHGEAWHIGDCVCAECYGAGWAVRRHALVTLAGDLLSHVGPTSWTPVVEEPPCMHPDPEDGAPCPGCGQIDH
ncbi:hypothetical protein WDV85_16975 [Pseudokineococcus sp. 5B2Z-1]|uniref:hypothetical protein n=1 Tax=Pseudokineococcus sp. 5B2Z-1 TaxID=3132744 RepID=UPI00309813EF